jgi:hypothetical protein
MTFRLELTSEHLLRLYQWLLGVVAGLVALYMVTLPVSVAWKVGGLVALAAGLWTAMRRVPAMRDAGVFAPVVVNGWALLALVLFLALSHSRLYHGEAFLGDWAKHRSVLLSLYQDPWEPRATGFLFDEREPDAPIPALYRLNYYYLPYLPAVVAATPLRWFLPDYAPDATAQVLAGLVSVSSLLLLLWAVVLMLGAVPQLWRGAPRPLSERAASLTLLLLPMWGGGEFFLEWIRRGEIPRIGPHYDGVFYSFFPFQVQNAVSLWNWVPSQLAAAAVGLALFLPFVRAVDRAPWALLVALLMGGVPFALFGLGAVAFLAVLQFQERYRWSWLRSEGLPFALQLGLATVVGLQALAFFAGKTLQDGFSNILSVNNNIANFAISVGREYVLIAVVLAGLAWRGRLTWWAAGGFLILLLGMSFVYLGHLNPWGLKTTIPVTLLMPFAVVALTSALPSLSGRVAFVTLVLVYLTPSFVYETFFAWNDGSNQVVLEKTKWIVDQYLGLPKDTE